MKLCGRFLDGTTRDGCLNGFAILLPLVVVLVVKLLLGGGGSYPELIDSLSACNDAALFLVAFFRCRKKKKNSICENF
jgi:hypothetical protein